MDKVLSNKKYIAIFVLPALLFYILFVLFPIVYNIYISMYRTDLMSKATFIGMTNYINLFNDRIFIIALKNNLLLIFGSLLAHMPLALFFANAIFRKIKGSKFFQSVFFLPTVICGVAVGMMFNFIYNSEFGIVNKILDFLNLSHLKTGWLYNEKTVMPALIIAVMWRFLGYHMVIQLAAMKNIPNSLYESMALDGATDWQQFKNITLPLIKNILKVDAVLIITGSIKYYDLIAAMTKGGPNHASEVMSTYMFYQGFRTLKFGYASSIGMILLIMCLLVIYGVNSLVRSKNIEY